ncbi:hypothetical protein PC113_g19323 [Phytophthora cactorum]|uniref:Uncharacterized protein n=1 Tax=Phytophthora cactorum TaxID=29920 RepID=A0A8T0YLD1_9STRA|nr:hypothetical protein PC113_g19323 [Phytophthora cactorum]
MSSLQKRHDNFRSPPSSDRVGSHRCGSVLAQAERDLLRGEDEFVVVRVLGGQHPQRYGAPKLCRLTQPCLEGRCKTPSASRHFVLLLLHQRRSTLRCRRQLAGNNQPGRPPRSFSYIDIRHEDIAGSVVVAGPPDELGNVHVLEHCAGLGSLRFLASEKRVKVNA